MAENASSADDASSAEKSDAAIKAETSGHGFEATTALLLSVKKAMKPVSHAKRRESFIDAARDVRDGMSLRKAAKLHGVSASQLSLRIKRGVPPPMKPGGQPRMCEEDERVLVDWCLELIRIGCPRIKPGLPPVTGAHLDAKKKVVFPPDNVPTASWVHKFLKRHPSITSKIPEHLSYLKTVVTYKDVKNHFTKMKSFFKIKNIDLQSFLCYTNAHRVFNCTENGFLLNANENSSGVILKRGSKTGKKKPEEGLPIVSVFLCVSAGGHLLKPLFMNKGRLPTEYAEFEGYSRNLYNVASSENGWMTGQIFYSWLTKQFHPELQEKRIERPVILFLDGHSSHILLDTISFAREHGIVLYCLPPQAAHILQPLEVGVIKTLKAMYSTGVRDCMGVQKVDLPRKHFAYVFIRALQNSNVDKNAIGGFKSAGLLPFRPISVLKEHFADKMEEEDEMPQSAAPVEEEVSGPSGLTAAEIYRLGFKAGQDDSLQRFEMLLQKDILEMYRQRLGVYQSYCQYQYEESYHYWRELKRKPPCTDNPFDVGPVPMEATHSSARTDLPDSKPSSMYVPALESSSLPMTMPSLTDFI